VCASNHHNERRSVFRHGDLSDSPLRTSWWTRLARISSLSTSAFALCSCCATAIYIKHSAHICACELLAHPQPALRVFRAASHLRSVRSYLLDCTPFGFHRSANQQQVPLGGGPPPSPVTLPYSLNRMRWTLVWALVGAVVAFLHPSTACDAPTTVLCPTAAAAAAALTGGNPTLTVSNASWAGACDGSSSIGRMLISSFNSTPGGTPCHYLGASMPQGEWFKFACQLPPYAFKACVSRPETL
jgi:hypothetical protein